MTTGRAAWRLVAAAAVSGALAVALGAFGAHALDGAVAPERLATWGTGAAYHLAHSVAAVLAGVAALHRPEVARAGWLFLLGVALFSGSLYALVLTDVGALGAVAPLGGAAFVAGWGALAWAGGAAAREG